MLRRGLEGLDYMGTECISRRLGIDVQGNLLRCVVFAMCTGYKSDLLCTAIAASILQPSHTYILMLVVFCYKGA